MKKVFKLLVFSFFAACMVTLYGCKKDTESPFNRVPTLETTDISGITVSTVETGGNITDDGGAEVTSRGVCWSRNEFPTTKDSKTANGTGSGSFTIILADLNPGTTYFARAYATNIAGTAYGSQHSFTTSFEQGASTQEQGIYAQEGDFPGGVRYSAVRFSIGNKVYIGLGYNDGDWPVKDFWEWDQTTNVWSRKANFPGSSIGDAVSFSIGTKGYIGFGDDFNTNGYTNEFWEYDPGENNWTQKASFPSSRGMAVGFSISTKGYIGTGFKDTYSASGYTIQTYQDFWEWDQATNIWTKKADFGGIARSGAVGFSIGNKGYIGTGFGDDNTLFKDFWEWDQATDVWTRKADFGGLARGVAVGFSIGNKGYIGTGYGDGMPLFKDFWEWDQATNLWTKKVDFGGLARSAAVGFSIGNKGYIGTGVSGVNPDYAFRDFWEWDQATDVWTK
jgi:hypothetical protein